MNLLNGYTDRMMPSSEQNPEECDHRHWGQATTGFNRSNVAWLIKKHHTFLCGVKCNFCWSDDQQRRKFKNKPRYLLLIPGFVLLVLQPQQLLYYKFFCVYAIIIFYPYHISARCKAANTESVGGSFCSKL